jgi:hypothetical protein
LAKAKQDLLYPTTDIYHAVSLVIGMGLFSRISKKKQAQIDDKIVSYDDAPDWFFDWQVNNKYLEFTEKPR